MEERLAQLDQRCPVCRARVEGSYLVCPVCTTRLRSACPSCGQPLESLWQVCPYCATDIPPGLPRSRTSRDLAVSPEEPEPQPLDSAAAWPAKRHSSSSSRTACAAALAGEIVARFERRGLELRGARLLKIPKGDGTRALRGAHGQAVLRLARRLHHVGPGTRARSERGVGDLGRPHDDGRDEPARLGARDDPRRLRARALREHRPRLGLEGERASRAGPVLPRRTCLSRTTSRGTARCGRDRTPSTRRPNAARAWAEEDRSRGASSASRSARWMC